MSRQITYQGIIPPQLRNRWRWVQVGWIVFKGDRFLFVGESKAEKRGYLAVEANQIGTRVPSWYQHRFIRPKKCPHCHGKGFRMLAHGPMVMDGQGVPAGISKYDCRKCNGTGRAALAAKPNAR